MEEKHTKIDYVKPEILDLGMATPIFGDCTGGNFIAGNCSYGGSPTGCDTGAGPSGGTCLSGAGASAT